jgi:2-keto-4-pentenoate hydratase
MVNTSTIETIAKQLRNASQTHELIPPIREIIGVEDLDTAYQIQTQNINLRVEAGARIVGRKIGLTNKIIQKQLGVDQPDFGAILDTMEVLNGDEIPWNELHQPKAEAEIAFILGKNITNPTITTHELISSIDYALPCIEIVGSRVENWNIKITDTIADNASASHYVLGHRPAKLSDFDMVKCKMKMTKNGEIASEGSGAACLGSPLNATIWLAKTMIKNGTPLRAGDVILTGALGPMVAGEPGDNFETEIEGLGSVSVSFGKKDI